MVRSKKKQTIRRPWFERHPGALDRLCHEVRDQFPNLHVLVEDTQVVVRGSIPVIHDGKELDRYNLAMHLSDDHPYGPALVYETGNRIPKKADDWHANLDGSLCIGVPEQVWPSRHRPLNLVKFLNGPVRTFLLRNSIIERGGVWPHGEWSHGAEGIYQYYEEKIGVPDRVAIRRFMECLAKPNPKGHWDCPCGSGMKIRNCHRDLICSLSKEFPIEAVRYSLAVVQSAVPKRSEKDVE